jgi:hypothetical protein
MVPEKLDASKFHTYAHFITFINSLMRVKKSVVEKIYRGVFNVFLVRVIFLGFSILKGVFHSSVVILRA